MFSDATPPIDPRRELPGERAPRIIDSRDLMQGERELRIQHGDEIYRLNVTRSGKLILRK